MMFDKFSLWDTIISLVAIGASVTVAICSRRTKVNSVVNFAFGEKNMSLTNIILSHLAATLSVLSTTIGPAETYTYGAQVCVELVQTATLGLIQAYVVWPVVYQFKFVSLFEYFELRFNEKVRLAVSFISTMYELIYCSLITHASALVIYQLTDIDVVIGRILCIGICVFYTILSGYRGIIFSDCIQMIVIFISTVFLITAVLLDAEGPINVVKKSMERDSQPIFNWSLDMTESLTVFGSLSRGLFLVCPSFLGAATYQRAISLATLRKAQISGIFLGIIGAMTLLVYYLLGPMLYSIYEGCDPVMSKTIKKFDELVPYYVSTKGKNRIPGLMGLYLAGSLCAAFSTIATFINNTGVVVYKDFILKLYTLPISDAASAKLIKSICFIFAILTLIITFVFDQASGSYAVFSTSVGLTSGAYFAILTLGILFPMVTSTGVLCACVPMIPIVIWLSAVNVMGMVVRSPFLPLSIDKCTFNVTGPITNLSIPMSPEKINAMNPVLKISSRFYGMFAYIFVIIVSIIISYITGPNKLENVDRKLLSPFIHRYLPQRPAQAPQMVPLMSNPSHCENDAQPQ